MTLFAFNSTDDHVDIVTDTISYGPAAITIGRCTKTFPLAHLGLVIGAEGASGPAGAWAAFVAHLNAVDFDTLDDIAAQQLPWIWEQSPLPDGVRANGLEVLHVGWSPRDERLAVRSFDSRAGFTPRDLTGCFYLMPDPDEPVEHPSTDAGWVELAEHVRAVAGMRRGDRKVLIGGDLIHTRVENGTVIQRRIHRFADNTDLWQQILSTDTLHPTRLRKPCDCRSGRRYADCCITAERDQPCLCGSGAALSDCCLTDALTAADNTT